MSKEPLFQCMECGKKYYSVASAERATFSERGCLGCGGSDIDIYVPGGYKK
jgi:ferredoxin-like protein FixX